MRSIRRSLLVYLVLLAAVALGAVAVFVDRFADAAIRAREEAETERIESAFDNRKKEALDKFDAELVAEARAMAKGVQSTLGGLPGLRGFGPGRPPEPRPKDAEAPPPPPNPLQAPPAESAEFRQRAAALVIGSGFGDRSAAVGLTALARGSGHLWSAYETPRAVARLQVPDALRRAYLEEDEHPGYFQFHVVAHYPGRLDHVLGVVRPGWLGADWSLNLVAFDRPNSEFYHDDVDVPGEGRFRRVVTTSRPFWVSVPFPVPSNPGPPPPPGSPPGFSGLGRGFRLPDARIQTYVHYARPYSELSDRLATDQQRRDDQLARVREETRLALAQLRARLGLIGAGSFAALVLGGWVIVARGLAPIRTLSVAVSRVSEKDFRLPVRPDELSGELVPIHARLTQALDLLRRAFAREKQAVADISHELRTPIASLLATIDVSLRKPRTPDQYRATLEDCRAIARQLGQLVERIMTLASLDAGNARTAVVRADAADLAARCGEVIRPLAAAHDLSFGLRAEPVEFDTDADKLREVLMNLLHNAVEYNRPGGRVELAVRRAAGAVVFEVRDTGIGMPPEVREKIFERFYRADPSRHATGVHAGLGLAIVKEYVERLHGTITVESEPGAGSTFRISLPAADAAPPAEAAPSGMSAEHDPPTEESRPEPRRRGETTPAGS